MAQVSLGSARECGRRREALRPCEQGTKALSAAGDPLRPSQGTATMKYRARMVPLSGQEGVVLVDPCGAARWPQASESRVLMARGRERRARSVFQSQAIRANQPGVKALRSSGRVKAPKRRRQALLSSVPAKVSSGFEQPRCCGTELALHGPLVREHTHG